MQKLGIFCKECGKPEKVGGGCSNNKCRRGKTKPASRKEKPRR